MTWTAPKPYGWTYTPPTPWTTPQGQGAARAHLPQASMPIRVRQATLKGLTFVGDDDDQLAQKVAALRGVVRFNLRQDLASTRGLLSTILQGQPRRVDGHHKGAEARAIFEWLRRAVRYVNEPDEIFQTLRVTVAQRIGDCDDFASGLASLFLAAGIPAALRVIKVPGQKGWAHIYTLARISGQWVAFDATENHPAGWQFPRPTAVQDYEVNA